MAQRPMGGITGVLGELISPTGSPAPSPCSGRRSPEGGQSGPANIGEVKAIRGPQLARVGRFPGRNARYTGPKEKVTLRVNRDLIAEYRDWSWEARSQLGELVERALAIYREARRIRG